MSHETSKELTPGDIRIIAMVVAFLLAFFFCAMVMAKVRANTLPDLDAMLIITCVMVLWGVVFHWAVGCKG